MQKEYGVCWWPATTLALEHLQHHGCRNQVGWFQCSFLTISPRTRASAATRLTYGSHNQFLVLMQSEILFCWRGPELALSQKQSFPGNSQDASCPHTGHSQQPGIRDISISDRICYLNVLKSLETLRFLGSVSKWKPDYIIPNNHWDIVKYNGTPGGKCCKHQQVITVCSHNEIQTVSCH